MISFEESIEHQKENIEPLLQGRSVTSLAKSFSGNPCELKIKNEKEKSLFEYEIDKSDDLDDPLDVWVKYIKWTNETYPHGQSAESGLVSLLERCIRRFINVSHYHDDPRYLRVWIQYVKYVDDPQELFCFLVHNSIGQSLSTFYEEYANFLEASGRKSQANEIYKLGIEKKARPFDRLKRRYDEFLKRSLENSSMNESNAPPVIPIRSILSTKSSLTLNDFDNIRQPNNNKKHSEKSRINVYADSENDERHVKSLKTNTWDNIGTLKERRKENDQKAKMWVGEKLPMKKKNQSSSTVEKFTVFCDEENETSKKPPIEFKIPCVSEKEKIIVNLEEIYHENEEFSLDELKAKSMNLLGKNWEDDNIINMAIPICLETEINSKDLLQDSPKLKTKQASPTVNTKAALEDIFNIFNQPLKCEQSDNSSDEDNEVLYQDNSVQDQEGNITWSRNSPMDKTYIDNFSEENKKYYRKDYTNDKSIEITNENDVDEFNKDNSSINLTKPILDDIEELLSNHTKPLKKNNSQLNEIIEPMSSPFQESVSHTSHLSFQKNECFATHSTSSKEDSSKCYIIKEHVCNPLEDGIRNTILSNLNPPINFYDGFYNFSDKIYGKLDLERFNKSISKKSSTNNQEVIIKLTQNTNYYIKKKLGEGAFAPVYLVENSNNSSNSTPQLRAIKIEHSTTPWEFYITRQAKLRLNMHRALDSIIDVYEMHIYHDVGFLIMKYQDQGTILDLVNMTKAETGNGIDEILAMFFTIELLRTLEQLHNKGILHGDLKPDNCLLRFDPIKSKWLSKYQKDGSGGWASKGIVIIDFGRGIDMKMFSPQVQFIADWETDEQDCAEMREARPWTYQIDYHGLATIIHTLLFGKHIETITEKLSGLGVGRKKYRLANGFKRYWQQDLWKNLFDLLLNPVANMGEEGLPITKNLKQIREKMENWLTENSEKGIGLKGSILKIEALLQERK